MSDELVERLLDWPYQGETMVEEAAVLIKQLTAERDRLRGGIEYVLDGYGLNGPDYRFKDGEDGDWISDRLIAVMKGETP